MDKHRKDIPIDTIVFDELCLMNEDCAKCRYYIKSDCVQETYIHSHSLPTHLSREILMDDKEIEIEQVAAILAVDVGNGSIGLPAYLVDAVMAMPESNGDTDER